MVDVTFRLCDGAYDQRGKRWGKCGGEVGDRQEQFSQSSAYKYQEYLNSETKKNPVPRKI